MGQKIKNNKVLKHLPTFKTTPRILFHLNLYFVSYLISKFAL